MARARDYGALPHVLGIVEASCSELMVYQYLPIKLPGQSVITRESRLACFDPVIGAALCDFVGAFGLDRFMREHVYITAKHLYQGPRATFNRPGWHSDGFMTDDINYIWCNRTPTVFNDSVFALSQDDDLSMEQMQRQARPSRNFEHSAGSLLRLDQFCIHRAGAPEEIELRTFVKISISADRYDLIGNSRNELLSYDWPMRPRAAARNIPQDMTKKEVA